jgi:hypothetical protein
MLIKGNALCSVMDGFGGLKSDASVCIKPPLPGYQTEQYLYTLRNFPAPLSLFLKS